MEVVETRASHVEPLRTAANSSFACVSDAVGYARRTSSRSMGESTLVESSRGFPRNSSLCLNRVGSPCAECSCCFNAFTSQSAATSSTTGMLATSCPDIILIRSIAMAKRMARGAWQPVGTYCNYCNEEEQPHAKHFVSAQKAHKRQQCIC